MTENRGTGKNRRIQAVEAGLEAFASNGVTTVAVQQVAQKIGVSESYVFRLFGSKSAFFLACIDELEARIAEAFSCAADEAAKEATDEAVEGATKETTDELLEAMGAGFRSLVSDGVVSGFWLQACAAAQADEDVARRCRTLIANVLRVAQAHTGADAGELAAFLGRGTLVIMLQALGVDMREGSQSAVASLCETGSAS